MEIASALIALAVSVAPAKRAADAHRRSGAALNRVLNASDGEPETVPVRPLKERLIAAVESEGILRQKEGGEAFRILPPVVEEEEDLSSLYTAALKGVIGADAAFAARKLFMVLKTRRSKFEKAEEGFRMDLEESEAVIESGLGGTSVMMTEERREVRDSVSVKLQSAVEARAAYKADFKAVMEALGVSGAEPLVAKIYSKGVKDGAAIRLGAVARREEDGSQVFLAALLRLRSEHDEEPVGLEIERRYEKIAETRAGALRVFTGPRRTTTFLAELDGTLNGAEVVSIERRETKSDRTVPEAEARAALERAAGKILESVEREARKRRL